MATRETQDYDLVVIGSGSGLDVSAEAADAGMRVAVVDNGPFGGTCLNRGCIPSKMLIHSADIAETIRGAERFGINAKIESVDWEKMMKRVYDSIDPDSHSVLEGNKRHPNITVFQDTARFVDVRTIEVGDQRIRGASMLIAAGTRPAVPDVPGLHGVRHMTSDQALRLQHQPRRMAIIGGGYIAAEMAHFFGGLGTEITLVYRGDRLLRHEDNDVSRTFTSAFQRRFDVRLNTQVQQVSYGTRGGQGEGPVVVEVSSSEGVESIEVDEVLFATGRIPNTDVLNAKSGGVELDERGYVVVDEFMRTGSEGTWALGDIVGRYELKHNANLEAAYVAHNLFNPESLAAVDYHAMPHAIFSSPQVAGVGLTEREARETGFDYAVGTERYIDTAYGEAIDDTDGFVKVIADRHNGEIIGCHVVGHDASILIQEAVNVMRARRSVDEITQSIYIHPALSEVVQRAFGALGL